MRLKSVNPLTTFPVGVMWGLRLQMIFCVRRSCNFPQDFCKASSTAAVGTNAAEVTGQNAKCCNALTRLTCEGSVTCD